MTQHRFPLYRSNALLTKAATLVLMAGMVAACVPAYAQPAPGEQTPPPEPEDTSGVDTQQLYQYRDKGQRAMDDGIYSAAARFFERYRDAAARKEPNFADATILLVKAYLKDGKPGEAEKALDHHKKNSPGISAPIYRNDLTYLQALTYAEQARWQKVVETIRPLAEESSTEQTERQALRLLGKAYARLQQWDKAQDAFSTLLDRFPESVQKAEQTRLELLKTYLAQDEITLAEQMMSALKEKPGDIAEQDIKLYETLLSLKNDALEQAYQQYKDIASDSPDKPDADWWTVVSALVNQLMDAGEWEKALTALSTAQSVALTREDRQETQLKKAKCLIQQEKTALAINALDEFEDEFPEAPEIIPAKMQLGELLRASGNPLSAANYFDDVAQNSEATSKQRYNAAISRGWCFNDAEEYDKANKAFLKATEWAESSSKKAEAVLFAGDAALSREDYAAAAELYNRITEELPDTPQAEKARYKQAVAYVKQDKHQQAARLFETYIEEFPDSKRIAEVKLEYGLALKNAGAYEKALPELQQFVEETPSHQQAPRALFAAYEAAMGLKNIDQAIEFLSQVLEDYPDADLAREALYTRAHTRFVHGRHKEAIADSKRFIEAYPELPLTAEILVWLGDHYANQQEWEKSRHYFLQLVNQHPDSDLAPLGLYEAAKNNYYLADFDAAKDLVDQLTSDYEQASSKILAQAHLLHGDIFAKQGEYNKAISPFTQAVDRAAESRIGHAARGRLAEMYFSIASMEQDDDENRQDAYEKAREHIEQLTQEESVSPYLRQKALYRKAKIFEKLKRTEAAIRTYLDLIYGYELETEPDKVPDWYYAERAGFDVCDLLIKQERYREAARIYERLAKFGTPASSEAMQRAAELRDAHNLGS